MLLFVILDVLCTTLFSKFYQIYLKYCNDKHVLTSRAKNRV